MAMNSDDRCSFGSLLKGFRTRAHFTQRQFAEAVGVHRNAIGRWERGDFLPASRGMVLELARHLCLNEQEIRQLLEASLTALSPHWHVPFRRNPFFTGREEILEALHTHLSTDQVVALTQSYALHGLGGVGKTQIALEYAYRHALEYSAVFWIEAETDETVLSSLLHIAGLLQLPERQETNQQRVVTAVQRWLSSHSQWLLIWDNLEDLELLPRLLPAVRQGAILLTTRCQALGTLARGMDLAPMEQEEGMVFVLRRAKVLEPEATGEHVQQLAVRLPGEYAAASELVTIMGGLPLALDQAGAYIEETGCGLAGYLLRYQQQRRHLLDRRGVVRGDHPHSVVATLWLACQRVAQQHPAALELVRFCAFLYPDAIPEELLLAGAHHLGPVLGPVVADISHFDAALATLRRFSLVQRHPETQTLSLHRLVQVILQEGMSEQEQAEFQQRAMCLLNTVFPEVPPETKVEIWEQCERLLPHVMTCTATIPEHLQDQELAEVFLKAARYLFKRSRYEQGEFLCQCALRLFEHTVGPEHLQVALSLHSLAAFYRSQGKYEQATLLYQRALRIREQALGPEHPDVAASLNNLAFVYRERGEYEQAAPLYQRALRIREQALGPEHPDVAFSLSELAILYRERGERAQAVPLYQRSLHILEQALGPEHPDVGRPLNNLADLYREQGKYEQAERLSQRAVYLFERALGPENPNVAMALDTLADLYREQGRYQQAQPLYQRVLRIFEQALGPEHPWVAYPLEGLANLFREQGKYVEAESLYQRALSIREQHLGQHHPETAQTLHELTIFHQKQGNLNEARSFAEHALRIRSQSLGDAHPKTVATRVLSTQLVQQQRESEERGSSEQHTEESRDLFGMACISEQASLSVQETAHAFPPESDPLQGFLDACCELHPRAWSRASELWQAYEQWVEHSRERFPLSRPAFIAQLKAHGCRAAHTNAARTWCGITLINKES